MSCPACTPSRPCEVCATFGQPLGLLLEPVESPVLVEDPLPPVLAAPVTGDERFDRLMNRLTRAIGRGDSANAAKCRGLIREHCGIKRLPVPPIAQRQPTGHLARKVAA